MAEVVQETQRDFWRPPVLTAGETVPDRGAIPAMAEACPRCGTEFLLGSRFCHSCGGRRPEAMSAAARADAAEFAGLWENAVDWMRSMIAGFSVEKIQRRIRIPEWLHYLHFHEIKRWIGLPTASLIAFILGIGCVAGALLVGLLTAKTLIDWQAIQYYRAEWLLAATASFVAGILLKKPSGN
jgi:hypothetical protein